MTFDLMPLFTNVRGGKRHLKWFIRIRGQIRAESGLTGSSRSGDFDSKETVAVRRPGFSRNPENLPTQAGIRQWVGLRNLGRPRACSRSEGVCKQAACVQTDRLPGIPGVAETAGLSLSR
jgi:hypothetical protein